MCGPAIVPTKDGQEKKPRRKVDNCQGPHFSRDSSPHQGIAGERRRRMKRGFFTGEAAGDQGHGGVPIDLV